MSLRAALLAVAALALVAAPAPAGPPAAPPAPVAVGARAPDIALGDQHGKPFRLADALKQGDFVVVAFYIRAFTDG